eukprot:scaffold98745_cov36-Cyclotella_meneghiniana.AAC.1
MLGDIIVSLLTGSIISNIIARAGKRLGLIDFGSIIRREKVAAAPSSEQRIDDCHHAPSLLSFEP